jgi:hypothetical protein
MPYEVEETCAREAFRRTSVGTSVETKAGSHNPLGER